MAQQINNMAIKTCPACSGLGWFETDDEDQMCQACQGEGSIPIDGVLRIAPKIEVRKT